MTYQFSRFGRKFTAASAIVDLMEDLGSALRHNPDMLMLGGGTPARIPEAEACYVRELQAQLKDNEAAHRLLGRYQGPMGDLDTRTLLANLLQDEYDWQLGPENIAVSNGGQSAFGILANMLAGEMPDGPNRRIHFPVVPEYLGYGDAGLSDDFFSATLPSIELLPGRRFKYHVDLEGLQLDDSIAALCLSRPTNPSGNILTYAELVALDMQAGQRNIPLIIDAAYGLPFPGLHYNDSSAYWSDNVILLLSGSKLGLPGLRSGFVVGPASFIEDFSRANTILNLASGNPGPLLLAGLLRNKLLLDLCRKHLRPWYQQKLALAEAELLQALRDVPFHMHVAEGAFFLWLWLPSLPITTLELYQRLKVAGVLVIPGDAAFPGLQQDWQHARECLRISYAVEESTMQRAAVIIGQVLREAYQH
jgi:valine--pyruvate aminotransferase